MGIWWSTEEILRQQERATERDIRQADRKARTSAQEIRILEKEQDKAPDWQREACVQTLDAKRGVYESLQHRQQTLSQAKTTLTAVRTAHQLDTNLQSVNKALDRTTGPKVRRRQQESLAKFMQIASETDSVTTQRKAAMVQLHANRRDGNRRTGGGSVVSASLPSMPTPPVAKDEDDKEEARNRAFEEDLQHRLNALSAQ